MTAVAITGAGVLVPQDGPAIADVSPERHLKDRKAIKYMDRLSMMAVRAAGDALVDAGLKLDEVDPYSVGLSMAVGHVAADVADFLPVIAAGRAADGSFDAAALGRSNRINPIAVFKTLSNIPVCNVSIALGIKGDNLILYPDAPQAARALEEGAWAIREGTARVVLAGGVASGVDFLNVQRRAMFARAAGDPARPPAADGSVVLVLEDEDAARARGARIRGRVRGLGEVGGSGTPYFGAPTAESVAGAVRGALEAAGASPRDVGLVIGGAMPLEHRAAERAGLNSCDLTAPIEYPADTTGDMSTASFAYGVHSALLRTPDSGLRTSLVLAIGHQGDVACLCLESA
jgi:3-oxoacyl-[acyl-carrier-protein] synthase II